MSTDPNDRSPDTIEPIVPSLPDPSEPPPASTTPTQQDPPHVAQLRVNPTDIGKIIGRKG